jgi:hypothetical protein
MLWTNVVLELKFNYTRWNISIAIKVPCNISIDRTWIVETYQKLDLNNKLLFCEQQKKFVQKKIFWLGFLQSSNSGFMVKIKYCVGYS